MGIRKASLVDGALKNRQICLRSNCGGDSLEHHHLFYSKELALQVAACGNALLGKVGPVGNAHLFMYLKILGPKIHCFPTKNNHLRRGWWVRGEWDYFCDISTFCLDKKTSDKGSAFSLSRTCGGLDRSLPVNDLYVYLCISILHIYIYMIICTTARMVSMNFSTKIQQLQYFAIHKSLFLSNMPG